MTALPPNSAAPASLLDAERAAAIYRREAERLHRSVDGMFFWVLLLEWAFAVLLAATVSPYTWVGRVRSMHMHVQIAILLGGVLNALPFWLMLRRPGTLLTRCTISMAQALWSGLLIHLTGGRIETHFHIFGSLAMLAFYRDWRVLIPATLAVTADHFLRGLYLPESIFGTTQFERFRFLEHAGWVVFEDLFLIIACIRGDASIALVARREAQMESAYELIEEQNERMEEKVLERTAQLGAERARQSAVLEACNAVFWEMELSDTAQFTYLEPRTARICGWSAEQFMAPGFAISCVDPADRPRVHKAFHDAPLEILQTIEYRFLGADGKLATLRVDFRREQDPAGSKIFRGSTLDVSKQRALELELLQAQKLESVGRLASGVAHEINTPVQFVSDSVHFVKESMIDLLPLLERYRGLEASVLAGNATPEAAQELAAMREEIDLEYLVEHVPRAVDRSLDGLGRVANIVRSMKAFAHPDASEMAPADLNRALESTLIIAKSEYKLVADLETNFGALPPIVCFAGELNQVFLNLIVNAAHAIGDVVRGTDNKGVIAISTAQDRDAVVISVRDTGGGIPAAIRERIFDPFFTTKEVGKGTGQGLAIARSVVQKHGGTIGFVSEPGGGTTFTVRLPIEKKKAA